MVAGTGVGSSLVVEIFMSFFYLSVVKTHPGRFLPSSFELSAMVPMMGELEMGSYDGRGLDSPWWAGSTSQFFLMMNIYDCYWLTKLPWRPTLSVSR